MTDQGFVAHLVIKLWSERSSGLPPFPHHELPPESCGRHRVILPSSEFARALLLRLGPARHRQTHVSTVPDQMDKARSRPESVEDAHHPCIARCLIPYQDFSLPFSVQIEDARDES